MSFQFSVRKCKIIKHYTKTMTRFFCCEKFVTYDIMVTRKSQIKTKTNIFLCYHKTFGHIEFCIHTENEPICGNDNFCIRNVLGQIDLPTIKNRSTHNLMIDKIYCENCYSVYVKIFIPEVGDGVGAIVGPAK